MGIQSNSSYLRDVGFVLGGSFALTAVDIILNRQFTSIATSSGYCLENLVSKSVKSVFNSWAQVATTPMRSLSNFFSVRNEVAATTFSPVLEELEFRYLLQQVMLKHLPKTVLDQVFPDHGINLDAAPFKILRTLITASLFAVLHTDQYSCDEGGGVGPLMGGLIYGMIIEGGGSVVNTINLHMIWNMFGMQLDHLLANQLGL
ncbi:type II CAAX prenyl endopeptidase Rce1 family protein [Simkania sp.]|uniref:CPBP family glutamic-type intramembrane protease n=1 Tax=Simkania sp. TaxID=34094 RepID=UPI003B52FA07